MAHLKFPDHLNTFLERMQNDEFFHDVVFVVENQRFPINRCIAAAASPVLRNMLTNGMKETFKRDIVLEDVNVRAWDRVLNYMYTGAVDFDNIDEALQCLECANRFQVEELEFELRNFIESKLDKRNCCQVVVTADRINLTGLRALAMKTIVENFHFVCRQCAFTDEAYDLILEILTDPELVVRSELDVFLAVMRWVVCSGVNEIEMEVDLQDELAKLAHETLIETGLLRPDSEFLVADSYNMSRHNQLFECVDMSIMSSMDLRRVARFCRDFCEQARVKHSVELVKVKQFGAKALDKLLELDDSIANVSVPVYDRVPHDRFCVPFSFSHEFRGVQRLIGPNGTTKSQKTPEFVDKSGIKWRVSVYFRGYGERVRDQYLSCFLSVKDQDPDTVGDLQFSSQLFVDLGKNDDQSESVVSSVFLGNDSISDYFGGSGWGCKDFLPLTQLEGKDSIVVGATLYFK